VNSTVDVLDDRILILTPTGKDAALAVEMFRREGLCSSVCHDLVELGDELRRGAGALVLAEEALQPRELPVLVEALRWQPAWSDVPVLILTRGRNPQEDLRLVQSFAPAGNVTLLERPLSTAAFSTAVQAALRTRRRQYQVRGLLEEQKQSAEAIQASRQEVLKLNAELEQRVAQRTAELRAANSELEAFCYSVSHDLRAPLRAIDGFALTALESCNGSLDSSARDYLERARTAAHRMQRLIDDLLALSRLSRTEMKVEQVNLSSIAALAFQELRQTYPNRKNVETIVAPEILVRGDAALLQIALGNLLGNAWKFTGKREQPVIEFGARTLNGSRILFVRDNGAGFDMAYASKLFTPFQRLHTDHEFPGSGIGLAIVQRVIRRHHGEVWAEGKRGAGACFYFRLPAGTELLQKETEAVAPNAA
jgi:signal transduction histidine kinase